MATVNPSNVSTERRPMCRASHPFRGHVMHLLENRTYAGAPGETVVVETDVEGAAP